MIGLISINHKTASLARRELFALTSTEATSLVQQWQAKHGISGAIVLSTCNRLELYYDYPDKITRELERTLITSLYLFKQVRHRGDEAIFTTLQQGDAVLHLFRLACGLESMVVGETQILGQIKDAYRQATAAGQSSPHLSRLCHRTFEAAKHVRSHYLLTASPRSAGAAAVDLMQAQLGDFYARRILLLGAGQMAEVITRRLQELKHPHIALYNRTRSRTEAFAEKHQIQHSYSEGELSQALVAHDLIFVATSSQTPIVTYELLAEGSQAKLFFDLAVPRNVDPALDELSHLTLYTIDDLRERGKIAPQEQSSEAIESYLLGMVADFLQWCEATEVREVIALIQQVSQRLVAQELSQLPQELTPSERSLVTHWDEHLRTTLTTALVSSLRQLSQQEQTKRYSLVLRQLFEHIQQTHL